MRVSIGDEIFEQVKDHMRVTWDYQDEEILMIINQGISTIESIAGRTDFEKSHNALKLLMNYSRYAWNGVSMHFQDNFMGDLLRLQLDNAIEATRGGDDGI